MEQNTSLASRIRKELLQELVSGIYQEATRLPPEVEIAARLGVSRTALRDALATLEQEGFISRRKGVGTIVNRHVLAVKTRMDLEEEFLSMVESAGKKAAQDNCTYRETTASPQEAACLKLPEGAPIFEISRLITADGEPAIYCVDTFFKDLLLTEDYDPQVLYRPVFEFLETYCGIEVYMDLTEVRAVEASPEAARQLQVPVGSPLLHMDETGYDFWGRPVLHSMEYYRDRALRHTVLRKKT